ncbi:MAG: hypothetical protein V3T77_01645 [Planctomycetota bacterium]
MRPFLLILGGILLLHLGLAWIHPNADPPYSYVRDHSLNVDGFWYLAEAKAWILGREPQVHESFRQPLVSYPTYLFYRLGGVNFVASRALNSLASMLTIALLAVLLYRRFGERLALVGALILALHPAWLVYVRSAVIYPWVAFWLLLIVSLSASRNWMVWSVGAVLMVLCAATLKSLLLVAAPAYAYVGWKRFRGSPWAQHRYFRWTPVALPLLLLAAFGPWSLPLFWKRVWGYMKGSQGGPWEHLLGFEERSGLFSTAPVLLTLSWMAGIFFITQIFPTRHGNRLIERSIHLTVWPALALLAVSGYTPLRYMLAFVPLWIYLAVVCVSDTIFFEKRSLLPLRPVRGFATIVVTLLGGAYLTTQLYAAASAPLMLPVLGVAAAAMVVGLAAAFWWWDDRPRSEPLVAIFSCFCVLPALPQLGEIITRRDDSLVRASRQLQSVVLPTADILGPYAHPLTLPTAMSAQQINSLAYGEGVLKQRVEELGNSHLISHHRNSSSFLGKFERDGVPVDLVESFQVRGKSVYLYRFRHSQQPRSAYEKGVQRLAKEDYPGAEEWFRLTLRGDRYCAPAWERLGEIRMRTGELQEAHKALEMSVALDPGRIEAHLMLASLYGSKYATEAHHHLQAVREVAPGNPQVLQLVEELEAKLNRGP